MSQQHCNYRSAADEFWDHDLPLQIIKVSACVYVTLWIAVEVMK